MCHVHILQRDSIVSNILLQLTFYDIVRKTERKENIMTILITGASGFLGRRAAEYFSSLGYDVLTPSHAQLDITDKPSVENWFRKFHPRMVLHCAAVSDTLVPRVMQALKQTGITKLAVAGGVAVNSRIRAVIMRAAGELGAEVYLPPLKLCGDNAAMIGAQGYYEYLAGNIAGMELNAYATKSILGEAI